MKPRGQFFSGRYFFQKPQHVYLFVNKFKKQNPWHQELDIKILAESIQKDNDSIMKHIVNLIKKDVPGLMENKKDKFYKLKEALYLSNFIKEQRNEERINYRQLKIRALGLAIKHSKRGTGPGKRKRYSKLVQTNLFGHISPTKCPQVW